MSDLELGRARINVDGAARGNPGPAAIGATIKNSRGMLVACVSQRIGIATNNQAEYRALIAALEKAAVLGARHIDISSDSELMVKQLRGQYRVRNAALKPLFERATKLLGALEGFSIAHVPRERNAEADSLANQALDA